MVASEASAGVARKELLRLPELAVKRFEGVSWEGWEEPLSEGGFVVKLGGVGPGPASVLPVKLHEGVHLMHGRVDGP